MDPFKHIVFRARMAEDEPAIATPDGVITYRALINAAAAASEALGTLSLDGTTLVGLDVRNPFFQIALWIALGLRGVPSASIQTEMSMTFAGVTPHLVLTDDAARAMAGLRTVAVGPAWFASAPARPDYAALLRMPGFINRDGLARVAFSSGTTGLPKAVAVSYAALLKRMEQEVEVPFPGTQRLVSMAAPSVLGFYTLALNQFCHGYMLCLGGSVDEMIHLTRVFQAGVIGMSVFQAQSFLKAMEDKPPLTSLQTLLIAGSKLLHPVLRELQAKLTGNVITSYVSTEAGGMTWGTGELLARGDSSVGYVLPGVSLEAVGADHGPLPPGETGLIRVRTAYLIPYINPADNAAMNRDGWFYPGDVGWIDAEGLVTIVGRASEIINHGGGIVAPEYVEEAMKTVPGVRDVAVFGVVNAMGVEEIWAAIVADDSLDPAKIIPAVTDRLRDKVPDKIVRVSDIPRVRMGKVQRKELRERVLAMPGVRG